MTRTLTPTMKTAMKRPLFALLTAAFATAAVAAERPMTAEEFDAYSRGKTFTYGAAGAPYGIEKYMEDRRVRWSFLDGKCKEGEWYPQGEQICFVYEDTPGDPQCWSFYLTASGLVARFENNPMSTELYEVANSPEEMTCMGPEVGV